MNIDPSLDLKKNCWSSYRFVDISRLSLLSRSIKGTRPWETLKIFKVFGIGQLVILHFGGKARLPLQITSPRKYFKWLFCKVGGALDTPNVTTVNSQCPYCVSTPFSTHLDVAFGKDSDSEKLSFLKSRRSQLLEVKLDNRETYFC